MSTCRVFVDSVAQRRPVLEASDGFSLEERPLARLTEPAELGGAASAASMTSSSRARLLLATGTSGTW
jgi:hypothetical protein